MTLQTISYAKMCKKLYIELVLKSYKVKAIVQLGIKTYFWKSFIAFDSILRLLIISLIFHCFDITIYINFY
jgi:hypothetical protein